MGHIPRGRTRGETILVDYLNGLLISVVLDEPEAFEGVSRGGEDGGARAGTMGDGVVERERSGACGQADGARGDEDEVVV